MSVEANAGSTMILVFGKTGQVARELMRQDDVVALGRKDADLSNPSSCAAAILIHKPQAVINAAAYTVVDKAEDEEDLATMVNAQTPGAMARVCAELGIPFLHISTDYVFPGDGENAWQEDDATAPLNAYGRSKLLGEKAVLSAEGNSAILRTSWVFSAHGNNFVKTMLNLAKSRSTLSVVNDQVGGPTPADKIAEALLTMAKAMINGQSGGLYHFAGQPNTSWSDFAGEIFSQSGKQMAINGIETRNYPTPAKRPLNSRLDCSKIKQDFGIDTPDWKEGLSRVLDDLKVRKK